MTNKTHIKKITHVLRSSAVKETQEIQRTSIKPQSVQH